MGFFLPDKSYKLDTKSRYGGDIALDFTHPKNDQCQIHGCPLHSPSAHPLRDAPQGWQRAGSILTRQCKCGCWHPDTDSLNYLQREIDRLEKELDDLARPYSAELGDPLSDWEMVNINLEKAKTRRKDAAAHTCCKLFCCKAQPVTPKSGRRANPLQARI